MELNKRDRAATTQRILQALGQVLDEEGLVGVRVNRIAEKAAVSKVLIYRYFGSIEGLLDYYLQQGGVLPQFSAAGLNQLQPVQPQDVALVWSSQSLQLFRQWRASRSSRRLLKATVKPNDLLAERVSTTLDAELVRLVGQLCFVKGGDPAAISAVVLGALSFLTIQAQHDRSMLGIDLRSEAGWGRIEAAVKLIYKGLAQSALTSATIQVVIKSQPTAGGVW